MKLLGVWTLFLSEKLYWDGSGRMEPALMPFLLGGVFKGLAGQDEGRETLAESEGKVRTREKGLLVGWREGKTQEDWITLNPPTLLSPQLSLFTPEATSFIISSFFMNTCPVAPP